MKVNLDLALWPKQLFAFNSPATEILFGGATEGGKSYLTRVLLISACLAVPRLQCVLIRKKLQDILDNHVEGTRGFRAMLKPLVELKQCSVTDDGISFANGSNVVFQHCQDERQFDSAQGVERQILCVDEATQIPERLIRIFRAWVRMPKEMKGTLPPFWKNKLPCILYTANPVGISVPFFRREFVERCPNESIVQIEGFRRQYIPSRWTDNPSVDEQAHSARLSGIGDAKLAEALDSGSWSVITGEYFPEWSEVRHVVSDFNPPAHWFRYRSFDWGTAEPGCCLFVAISDGNPFHDDEGYERWFPRGSRIFYRELYWCDVQHPEKGIGMRNADMATEIRHATEEEFRRQPTLADSKPFQDTGGKTPAQEFAENGVVLTQLPMGPGSRVAGWSMVRDSLIGRMFPGFTEKLPLSYFCECCKYSRDYLPALPRHPSPTKQADAAEHGEATHACDAIRYAHVAYTVVKELMSLEERNVQEVMNQIAKKGPKRPTMKTLTGLPFP